MISLFLNRTWDQLEICWFLYLRGWDKNIGGMNESSIIYQCCIKAPNKSIFLWNEFTNNESRLDFSNLTLPVSFILSESLAAYLLHSFGVCESIWKLCVTLYQATSCLLGRVCPEPDLQFHLDGWPASSAVLLSMSLKSWEGYTSYLWLYAVLRSG